MPAYLATVALLPVLGWVLVPPPHSHAVVKQRSTTIRAALE